MKKRKFLINIFLICSTIGIFIWLGFQDHKDNKIQNENKNNTYITQNIKTEENKITEKIEQKKEYPKEQIAKEYKGYLVDAKLEIPQILLETYILKNYSVQALNVSVTKFWGVNPNEIGNFCVAGHNFQNKNMFHNLKKLKMGDKLFISDNQIGKIEYEIYNIYKVPPEDVSCLEEETNGKREVTLITCTNDSKERIIVKAREIL